MFLGNKYILLEGHSRYVNCGAFNPTGELLVTGSNDRSFNIWKLSGALCGFENNLRPTSEGAAIWNLHGDPLQNEILYLKECLIFFHLMYLY